ncbi:MAG: ABC-type transport auxiliary lipoprotein family protein [Comamonas sp.]
MSTLMQPSMNVAQRIGRNLALVSAVAMLVACSALPQQAAPVVRYDFGLGSSVNNPAVTAAAAQTRAPLVMAPVKAASVVDASTAIVYRLAYANDRELRPYSQARWSAPAAQLIQQRMRDTLSQSRAVLMANDGATQALVPAAPPAMLRLEVSEFSQVFDSTTSSRGVLRLRATLTELTPKGEKWLGQQVFDVSEPASSGDAAGGTAAMAAASTQAAQQLDNWLRQLGR